MIHLMDEDQVFASVISAKRSTKDSQTVHEYVRGVIRSAILSSELKSGKRLFQAELASLLGVSITPVREALRDLATEGLVRFDRLGRRRRGASGRRGLDLSPLSAIARQGADPGSTGRGLWIARNLARQMGGDLSYQRQSGRTIFEVTLPGCPPPEAGRGSELAGARPSGD